KRTPDAEGRTGHIFTEGEIEKIQKGFDGILHRYRTWTVLPVLTEDEIKWKLVEDSQLMAELRREFIRWINCPPEERSESGQFGNLAGTIELFNRNGVKLNDAANFAAAAHLAFITLHFFEDGNHQTGWEVMNRMRRRDGFSAIDFKDEWYAEYQDLGFKDGNPRPFINFIRSKANEVPIETKGRGPHAKVEFIGSEETYGGTHFEQYDVIKDMSFIVAGFIGAFILFMFASGYLQDILKFIFNTILKLASAETVTPQIWNTFALLTFVFGCAITKISKDGQREYSKWPSSERGRKNRLRDEMYQLMGIKDPGVLKGFSPEERQKRYPFPTGDRLVKFKNYIKSIYGNVNALRAAMGWPLGKNSGKEMIVTTEDFKKALFKFLTGRVPLSSDLVKWPKEDFVDKYDFPERKALISSRAGRIIYGGIRRLYRTFGNAKKALGWPVTIKTEEQLKRALFRFITGREPSQSELSHWPTKEFIEENRFPTGNMLRGAGLEGYVILTGMRRVYGSVNNAREALGWPVAWKTGSRSITNWRTDEGSRRNLFRRVFEYLHAGTNPGDEELEEWIKKEKLPGEIPPIDHFPQDVNSAVGGNTNEFRKLLRAPILKYEGEDSLANIDNLLEAIDEYARQSEALPKIGSLPRRIDDAITRHCKRIGGKGVKKLYFEKYRSTVLWLIKKKVQSRAIAPAFGVCVEYLRYCPHTKSVQDEAIFFAGSLALEYMKKDDFYSAYRLYRDLELVKYPDKKALHEIMEDIEGGAQKRSAEYIRKMEEEIRRGYMEKARKEAAAALQVCAHSKQRFRVKRWIVRRYPYLLEEGKKMQASEVKDTAQPESKPIEVEDTPKELIELDSIMTGILNDKPITAGTKRDIEYRLKKARTNRKLFKRMCSLVSILKRRDVDLCIVVLGMMEERFDKSSLRDFLTEFKKELGSRDIRISEKAQDLLAAMSASDPEKQEAPSLEDIDQGDMPDIGFSLNSRGSDNKRLLHGRRQILDYMKSRRQELINGKKAVEAEFNLGSDEYKQALLPIGVGLISLPLIARLLLGTALIYLYLSSQRDSIISWLHTKGYLRLAKFARSLLLDLSKYRLTRYLAESLAFAPGCAIKKIPSSHKKEIEIDSRVKTITNAANEAVAYVTLDEYGASLAEIEWAITELERIPDNDKYLKSNLCQNDLQDLYLALECVKNYYGEKGRAEEATKRLEAFEAKLKKICAPVMAKVASKPMSGNVTIPPTLKPIKPSRNPRQTGGDGSVTLGLGPGAMQRFGWKTIAAFSGLAIAAALGAHYHDSILSWLVAIGASGILVMLAIKFIPQIKSLYDNRNIFPQISDFLSSIETKFTRDAEEILKGKHAICLATSKVLGRVLNNRLGISLEPKDPIHLEIVAGLKREKKTVTVHWWLALVVNGKKRLFIDPTHFQFDPEFKSKILVRPYRNAMKKLHLEEVVDWERFSGEIKNYNSPAKPLEYVKVFKKIGGSKKSWSFHALDEDMKRLADKFSLLEQEKSSTRGPTPPGVLLGSTDSPEPGEVGNQAHLLPHTMVPAKQLLLFEGGEDSSPHRDILKLDGTEIRDNKGEQFILDIKDKQKGPYPVFVEIRRKEDTSVIGTVQFGIGENRQEGVYRLAVGLADISPDYQRRGIFPRVLSLVSKAMPDNSELYVSSLEETDTLKALASGTSWARTRMGRIFYRCGWKPDLISIYDRSGGEMELADPVTRVAILFDRNKRMKEFYDPNGFRAILRMAIRDIEETDTIEEATVYVSLSRIRRAHNGSKDIILKLLLAAVTLAILPGCAGSGNAGAMLLTIGAFAAGMAVMEREDKSSVPPADSSPDEERLILRIFRFIETRLNGSFSANAFLIPEMASNKTGKLYANSTINRVLNTLKEFGLLEKGKTEQNRVCYEISERYVGLSPEIKEKIRAVLSKAYLSSIKDTVGWASQEIHALMAVKAPSGRKDETGRHETLGGKNLARHL
ncbi:MAG: Fic family protein, partial [Candidatus Omnitrophica bacterium]|nr:Fic family protein [Candidatus Omnitrophota bacterium]